MTRATFLILTIAFLCAAVEPISPTIFESPCECHGNQGKTRLAVKEDSSTPRMDTSAIKSVTPSDIFSWPGPTEHLTAESERTGIENNWFAVTGRLVALRAETDCDLHLELQDASGDKPGIVVVEVPAKAQWCEIRKTVFDWTQTQFPFHTSSARKLNITNPPIITVIGKAFFDVGHSLKNQSNRRRYQPNCAAYEIHPVMKLEVQ